MMLLQRGVKSYKAVEGKEEATMLLQTVRGNYEGYTKQEV
jgi:hypothetical protein